MRLQHGIEWEKKGTHEKHLSVLDFEKKERAKEVAELEQAIFGSKEELSDILHQQIAAGQETEQIRKEGETIRQEVSELTATNHLLKEQAETLAEDKEKLLSENEKLEKQQKKLQQDINKMVQSKEAMERNIHAYDEDVKWQLHYRAKKEDPVILFIHGGPGTTEATMAYLVEEYEERNYNIVYYDQRGTGKTYLKTRNAKPNTGLLKQDLLEIVLYLKKRYQKEKIGILGHSWGSVLGVLMENNGESIRFKSPGKEHDILYTMSSGQLSAVLLSFSLALNKIYAGDGIKTVLIVILYNVWMI